MKRVRYLYLYLTSLLAFKSGERLGIRRLATAFLAVGLVAVMSGADRVVAATGITPYISSCLTDGYHWYGRATSGTGATIGTLINTYMPTNYYAPSHVTDDEAAWLFNPNTAPGGYNNSAIELGWFQGFWPYPGTGYGQNFSYPQGYVTFTNGSYGSILTGRLPANLLQFEIADAGGTGTALQITNITTNTFIFGANNGYYVTYPRTNMSQGEVAGGYGAWMGGNSGNGTISSGQWEPSGSQEFRNWGSYTMCDNSPYFIQSRTGYSWKNGGK